MGPQNDEGEKRVIAVAKKMDYYMMTMHVGDSCLQVWGLTGSYT